MTQKAINILSTAIITQPMFVDEETINIIAELCIICKAFLQAYEVCVCTCVTLCVCVQECVCEAPAILYASLTGHC